MGTVTRPIAVFDLDGTLSDTRHRLHLVAPGRKDWDAFFQAARRDPPLADGVALAQKWAHECDLGYVTGRPERCRADTELWLAEQGLPSGELWMRREDDRRPARVTKPALLEGLAARRTVAVVVDDDRLVCAEYRKAGFKVVVADWMPEAAPLRQAQHEGRT